MTTLVPVDHDPFAGAQPPAAAAPALATRPPDWSSPGGAMELWNGSDEDATAQGAPAPGAPPAAAAPAPGPDPGTATPPVPVQSQPLPDIGTVSTTPVDFDPFAQQPKVGWAQDQAESGLAGLQKGTMGLLGTGPDAAKLSANIGDWLSSKITGKPMSPQQHEMARQLAAAIIPFGLANGPTSQQANDVLQSVVGEYHRPQTQTGKYVESVGEFVPGVLTGPEGAGLKVASAVVPGLAAQGMSDAIDQVDQGNNGWAKQHTDLLRLGAGAAGLVATHGVGGLARGTEKLVGDSIAGATPDQIREATQLMREGEAVNTPITFAEAIQKVTGGATRAGNLQRVLEGTPEGKTGPLATMFSERPAAYRSAVANWADQVAPRTDTPSDIGARAQAAAKAGLGEVDKQRSQMTTPLYDVVNDEQFPQQDVSDLMDAIGARAAADKTGIVSGPLNKVLDQLTDDGATAAAKADYAKQTAAAAAAPAPSVRGAAEQAWAQATGNGAPAATPASPALPPGRIPVTDGANLDRVRKNVRDDAENGLASGHYTPEQAKNLRDVADWMDQLLEQSPTFRQAKALHINITDNDVRPLQAGPVGKIAATQDVGSQAQALYPTAAKEGAAAETAKGVRMLRVGEQAAQEAKGLGALSPGVESDLTRQHVMNTFNEATQANMAGMNQWGPSKFAAGIAGNDEQAAALHAGVSELPNGEVRSAELARLLDLGAAMGQREKPGSLTAFNAKELADWHGSSLGHLLKMGANPFEWGELVGRGVDGAAYKMRTKGLSQALLKNADEAEPYLLGAREKSTRQSRLLSKLLLQGPENQSGSKPGGANP